MEVSRQEAFQRLRPACVELSSVGLKFRGKQTTVKAVQQALEKLFEVLKPLGRNGALDEKLSEYVFFPLSTCFNETTRLSSSCLEVCIRCLQILVADGWKQKLAPATGQQLLILLTWIAGSGPGQNDREPPSEELLVAVFECMSDIFTQLGKSPSGQAVLDQVGSSTVVDQITYFLLEIVDGNSAENVQLAALATIHQLWSQITNRAILASLMPRTVTTLTKALRSTTQARRTAKILVANLNNLKHVIQVLLNDQAIAKDQSQPPQVDQSSNEVVLDKSWLNATTTQIKLALAQVIKLRNHDRLDVREALADLCIMVIEDCSSTLAESLTLVTETLVVICSIVHEDDYHLTSTFRHIVTSHPHLADTLKSSLYSWTMSLPRIMQGNDDKPKQRILRQISFTFYLLSTLDNGSEILDETIVNVLCESVTAALQASKPQAIKDISESNSMALQPINANMELQETRFSPIILDHRSQRDSIVELQGLIQRLTSSGAADSLTSAIVQRVPLSTGDSLLSSLWLSLQFLQNESQTDILDSFLDLPSSSSSRPFLVEELYSSTIQYLEYDGSESLDWRLTALTLEVVNLQAQQLGQSFRPELIDVLYPVLTLLGTSNTRLREHAMVTLNNLSKHLEYRSVSDMLNENVDYLINSVALKLNTFDLSPQGPQVMLMMLRLCGAAIIPYLDDLVFSIFSALDTFHGYPRLVEVLFQVLEAIVDESGKSDRPAIEGPEPAHKKSAFRPSTINDILEDLRARKKRKLRDDSDTDPLQVHPKRPWSSTLDGPEQEKPAEINIEDPDEMLEEDDSAPLPQDKDKIPTPSKSHALLLSIARSTIPHLSSPSPAVRVTCLNLLARIIPLLARDENTFLPVVNDIWDAVVARLFPPPGSESEVNYINVAAAHAISAMCTSAGDFMSTRIEDLFPQLEKLYKAIWRIVESDKRRQLDRPRPSQQPRKGILGASTPSPVEILTRETQPTTQKQRLILISDETDTIEKPSPQRTDMLTAISSRSLSTNTASQSLSKASNPSSTTTSINTSTSTFHTALLHLLASLLQHVRLPVDMGNRILQMVSPALFGQDVGMLLGHAPMAASREDKGPPQTTIPPQESSIRAREEISAAKEMLAALESWNGDAVWLIRKKKMNGLK